jgi:hypothetical protein
MSKYITHLILSYLVLLNQLHAQTQPCVVKGAHDDIINNGSINGTLFQARTINNINIFLGGNKGTFRLEDNLFFFQTKNKEHNNSNPATLDTVNKRAVATEMLQAATGEECILDVVRDKISKGQFDLYQTPDKSTQLIRYYFEQGELDNYNFKTIYKSSDGLSLVHELNKYYYIKDNGAFLTPFGKHEAREYDFATDFNNGLALVGDSINNTINYYFINKTGKTKDTTAFSQCIKTDKYFFLRTRANLKQLFSRRGELMIGNIDDAICKSEGRLLVEDQFMSTMYIKSIDTIDLRSKTFAYKTIFNECFIKSNSTKECLLFFKSHRNSPKHKNIFIIKQDSGLFVYNSKTHSSSHYYSSIDDFNESGICIVTKLSGGKNLINESGKELLSSDYAAISISENNIVASGGFEVARYIINGKNVSFEGTYQSLTQIDEFGYGFWAKTNNGSSISGFYTSKGKDTLPELANNCPERDMLDRVSKTETIRFSGFNKDKIALVRTNSRGPALINTNREFITPLVCHDGSDITLQHDSIRRCSVVKIEHSHLEQSAFLVRNGKRISQTYKDIKPFGKSEYFKIASYDKGLKWGLINTEGGTVVPTIYTQIKEPDENGFFRVTFSDKDIDYGLRDMKGKVILDCKYLSIKTYKNGLIAVKSRIEGWSILDYAGKLASNYLQYDDLDVVSESYLLVRSGGRMGLVSWQNKRYVDVVFRKISWDGKYFTCEVDEQSFRLEPSILPAQDLKCIGGNCNLFNKLRETRNVQ